MEMLTDMVRGAGQTANSSAKMVHGGLIPPNVASAIAHFEVSPNVSLDEVINSRDSSPANIQNTNNNHNGRNDNESFDTDGSISPE